MPNMTMVWAILGGLKPGDVLENVEPDGHVQQTQAHHGEAHDRAGGESHVQAPVEALMGGVGSAGVGGGGNLHAHKARQAGPDAAGQEGEGDKPVVQHPDSCQNQQNDEDDDKIFATVVYWRLR